jgi:hypothetical protein
MAPNAVDTCHSSVVATSSRTGAIVRNPSEVRRLRRPRIYPAGTRGIEPVDRKASLHMGWFVGVASDAPSDIGCCSIPVTGAWLLAILLFRRSCR